MVLVLVVVACVACSSHFDWTKLDQLPRDAMGHRDCSAAAILSQQDTSRLSSCGDVACITNAVSVSRAFVFQQRNDDYGLIGLFEHGSFAMYTIAGSTVHRCPPPTASSTPCTATVAQCFTCANPVEVARCSP